MMPPVDWTESSGLWGEPPKPAKPTALLEWFGEAVRDEDYEMACSFFSMLRPFVSDDEKKRLRTGWAYRKNLGDAEAITAVVDELLEEWR